MVLKWLVVNQYAIEEYDNEFMQYGLNVSFIIAWNKENALHNPKGIMLNS